jgi:hypothetical protein
MKDNQKQNIELIVNILTSDKLSLKKLDIYEHQDIDEKILLLKNAIELFKNDLIELYNNNIDKFSYIINIIFEYYQCNNTTENIYIDNMINISKINDPYDDQCGTEIQYNQLHVTSVIMNILGLDE